jgi:hypothetical protein
MLPRRAMRLRAFVATPCTWLLLSGVLPRAGSAQQTNSETDELTQAILRFAFRYDGGHVRVVRGDVPEDLRRQFYAPPGTRVLGTVVRNSGALVIAATSTPPESLRVLYARALEPRGWKRPESVAGRGFLPSVAELPIILCRQGAQLLVTSDRRVSGAQDLYLDYRDEGGACTAESRAAFVREGMREPPLPPLYAPPPAPDQPISGCYARGGGRGGGSAMSTSTVVSTTMSADDLLAHYAAQLAAAGWEPATAARGHPAATGTYVRTDSTGTLQLALDVSGSGGRCYDVQMRVMTGRISR